MRKLISKWDFIDFQTTRGLTINGIPLFVDEIYVRENKSIDSDGTVLYHHIERICGSHVRPAGKAFFYCHPALRIQLEERERRN